MGLIEQISKCDWYEWWMRWDDSANDWDLSIFDKTEDYQPTNRQRAIDNQQK